MLAKSATNHRLRGAGGPSPALNGVEVVMARMSIMIYSIHGPYGFLGGLGGEIIAARSNKRRRKSAGVLSPPDIEIAAKSCYHRHHRNIVRAEESSPIGGAVARFAMAVYLQRVVFVW